MEKTLGEDKLPAKSGKDENSIEYDRNDLKGTPASEGTVAWTGIVEGLLGGFIRAVALLKQMTAKRQQASDDGTGILENQKMIKIEGSKRAIQGGLTPMYEAEEIHISPHDEQ